MKVKHLVVAFLCMLGCCACSSPKTEVKSPDGHIKMTFEIVLFPRQCGRVGHFPAVLVIFAVRMDAHAVLQSETSHLQVVSRAPEARQSEGIRTEIPGY